MTSQRRALAAGCVALVLASCSSGTGPTVSVNGTVLGGGLPAVGKNVILSSGTFSKTEVTDADGTFSVADVPVPYAATVSDGSFAIVYQGLTRTDPTLTDLAATTTQPLTRTATLYGQFSGGGFPESMYDFTSLVFASPQVVTASSEPLAGTYAAQVTWYGGPSSTTGTLYAIQVHNTYGGLDGPAGYFGYGLRSNVTLTNTGVFMGQDVTLAPVTTGTLSGAVTTPTGYSLSKALQLFVAPGVSLSLTGNNSEVSNGTFNFSYAVPLIDGTSIALGVTAYGPDGDSVSTQWPLSADAGVTLSLPLPPSLTLPADEAADVTLTTSFSWTALPQGVHVFQVYGNGVSYLVVTAGTTATLLELIAGGRMLLGVNGLSWNVVGIAPVASVDATAAAGGFEKAFQGATTQAQSAERTFSVAP